MDEIGLICIMQDPKNMDTYLYKALTQTVTKTQMTSGVDPQSRNKDLTCIRGNGIHNSWNQWYPLWRINPAWHMGSLEIYFVNNPPMASNTLVDFVYSTPETGISISENLGTTFGKVVNQE